MVRVTSVVERTVEIAAPVAEVFAYVDDYSKTRDWMYGLKKIEPVGEQTQGVGAEYDGVMHVGVPLRARIRCTAWEKDRLLELSSVSGIENQQRWTFTPVGEERTRVEARITYKLPGGPAGRAIAAAMKPVVGVAIRHTSESLLRNLERR